MGAGKTLIAKGIAKGLGISEEVTSPTYAYINSYEGRLFHFDCYRIQSERQAEELGFADYFDLGGICLVEWSENIAGLLPEQVKRVTIRKRGRHAAGDRILNYLAIDTSGEYLTVIAKHGERTERVFRPDCLAKHSVVLMEEIDGALSHAQMTAAEVRLFRGRRGTGVVYGHPHRHCDRQGPRLCRGEEGAPRHLARLHRI